MHPNLSSAHIVLGIKEIPLSELADQSGYLPLDSDKRPRSQVPRTHLMFSHTGKGQSYNMPLLSKFIREYQEDEARVMDQRSEGMQRLIDYELLTDGPAPGGKRVVAFGWFAGGAPLCDARYMPILSDPSSSASGATEGLCASAHDFLSLGVASPFLVGPVTRTPKVIL